VPTQNALSPYTSAASITISWLMPGRALAACGGPCAQRGLARARLSCREAPSLNTDIGPRAFRVVPSRGGTGHPTLDRAEHLCPLASATNPASVCRFFEPCYGPQEPQRVAARGQGIRREEDNPSHIGASNPPISEAASLSSEVTISTLRATCQGSALLADASSFTSKSTSMPVMRVRASSSDTASRRNRTFFLRRIGW
jgi:hypothetical protein